MDHTHTRTRSKPSRMTVAEAARIIGVCPQTVRNLAHAGKLSWFWGNGTERPSGLVASSVSRFLRGCEGRGRVRV